MIFEFWKWFFRTWIFEMFFCRFMLKCWNWLSVCLLCFFMKLKKVDVFCFTLASRIKHKMLKCAPLWNIYRSGAIWCDKPTHTQPYGKIHIHTKDLLLCFDDSTSFCMIITDLFQFVRGSEVLSTRRSQRKDPNHRRWQLWRRRRVSVGMHRRIRGGPKCGVLGEQREIQRRWMYQ